MLSHSFTSIGTVSNYQELWPTMQKFNEAPGDKPMGIPTHSFISPPALTTAEPHIPIIGSLYSTPCPTMEAVLKNKQVYGHAILNEPDPG